jgi:hemoglobin
MKSSGSRFFLVPVAAGVLALVMACGAKKPPAPVEPTNSDDAGTDAAPEPPPPPKSLFEKVGKKEGLTKVVDSFVKNLAADPRVNKSFGKLKAPQVEKYKAAMVEQLCELAGGDCKNDEKALKELHKPLKLTEKQFEGFVDDLKNALAENTVAEEDIAELLGKLAPKRDEIVEPAKKK